VILLPGPKAREFQRRLLHWDVRGKRSLPWRQHSRTAYEVLIAELLLRKTGMVTVRRVYDEFLARFPSPDELARAEIAEIGAVIGVLGLADRARLLKAMAHQLIEIHSGQVPRSKAELKKLAGVGDYTAHAVLCFAYGKSLPLVDSNVVRVLQRVFSFKSSKRRPHTDPVLWQASYEVIAGAPPVRANQALLDFAGTVCVHRNPKCDSCPMRDLCDYFQARGDQSRA